MKIDNSLKFGLSPTIQIANNITAFAALFPLKKDDPDAHAKAIAGQIGSKEFADALNNMALIHLCYCTRVGRDHFVWQTNFDGDLVAYFEVFKELEGPVRQLLNHMDGAPGPEDEFTEILDYFGKHQVETFGYYCAYPELTVNQIHRDADWRNKVMDFQKSLARPTNGIAVGQTVSGM